MTILLLLFIIFVVVPLASAMYKIWSFRRRMRRFMEDPFGQGAYGQTPRGDNGRRRQQPRYERQEKKIPRDVGEYVAFTEYEASSTTESGSKQGRTIRTESQITDVEWIDIEK